MKSRILKLINNERTNVRIASKKGDSCLRGAVDICIEEDHADCSLYAYDSCIKDHAACQEGADDICNVDNNAPCMGPGAYDRTY